MLIAEIFESIQGEGRFIGVPSVFVRTAGCNLRCRWCDTPYASWEPEGTEMDVENILKQVTSFSARHVVLTGGEPMVAKNIHELAEGLRVAGKHITIETAGTVPPENIACDLASLSPKLSNSTPDLPAHWCQRHEATRFQPEVLRHWTEGYDVQLKFVFQTAADVAEIDEMLKAVDLAPENVFLMPEGVEREGLRRRAPEILEICKARGFRYAPRLHIELFGNQRGV